MLSRAQAPDFPSVLADAAQSASGTLIPLGPSHAILLNGLPPASLHPNNFLFV